MSIGNQWRAFIERWFVPVSVSEAAEIIGEIPADAKVYCPPSKPAPANSSGAAKKPFVTLHVPPGILNSGTEIGGHYIIDDENACVVAVCWDHGVTIYSIPWDKISYIHLS